MRGVKKSHLPEKNRTVCGRPLVWRRKWAACRADAGDGGERGRRHHPRGDPPRTKIEPAVTL